MPKAQPTLSEEMALSNQGFSSIAGLDEVGRGCLAGPVVAAAVILPLAEETPQLLQGVTDSKQLSEDARNRYFEVISQVALAIGVGIVSAAVIDRRNILNATKQAMLEALAQLSIAPQALLLDAITLPKVTIPQHSLIKGDARSLSIASASIIAKVTRDRLMIDLDAEYPAYGFKENKGYGTPTHLQALREYGATPHHRMTFAPVQNLYGLFPDL